MRVLKRFLAVNVFFAFVLNTACFVYAQTQPVVPSGPPPYPNGGPVVPVNPEGSECSPTAPGCVPNAPGGSPVTPPSHNPPTQPPQVIDLIGGPSDPLLPEPDPDPDFEGGLLIGETAPDSWTVIDFHDFGGALMEENDPFDVGGSVGEVVHLDARGNLLVGNGFYDLGDDGIWDEGRDGYAVLQGGGGTIDFLNPVSGLGVFLNPQAFQYGGQLQVSLDSINGRVGYLQMLYNGQPDDVNKGFFLGFWSQDVDIKRVTLLTEFEYAIAIDDIAFTRASSFDYALNEITVIEAASTPEPATMALFATGLAGALVRRRKA